MPVERLKIGLIVNPIAGMGGSVGLKGTDGPDTAARARALGARAVAPERALRALRPLVPVAGEIDLIAAPGVMGGDVAVQAGLAVTLLAGMASGPTTADDTVAAARALHDLGARLILFAGGDGTARDVHRAVGEAVPVLGIPSGVKMHSAVFATSPEAAGQLVALMATDRQGRLQYRQAEIMDIDEGAVRDGRMSARLHGYARMPFERHFVQNAKAGGLSEDAALDAVCREIAEEIDPRVIHIMGPGTSTQRILEHLGMEGTLLGVDAVLGRRLIGRDLRADEIESLVGGQPARIVVSVIGGQGYVFGRGNQQIGPAVIRAVGRDNLVIVASQRKLLSLPGPRLLVDTGDRALDEALQGYVRVRIGPRQSTLVRLCA